MSERNYNNQSITDYLLGSLPEEEAEHFDELSFTDEKFSGALKAVENDLIDAYVNDELDGATLEKFKTYYLASPIRREKVEFAESFQVYAGQNTRRQNAENVSFFEQPKSKGLFAFRNIFASPALRRVSMAAVLILIACAGFWIINKHSNNPEIEVAVNQKTPAVSNVETPKQPENNSAATEPVNKEDESPRKTEKAAPQKTPAAAPPRPPRPKEDSIAAPVFASFVLAAPLRGANQLQTISFSKQTTVIKMTLNLEGSDFKTYRVALVDESNKSLRRSGNLKSRSETISVSFPANLLKPGVYSLILSGVKTGGDAEIIGNYAFKSVLK